MTLQFRDREKHELLALYQEFLLSAVAADLMLGEVEDHLFLSDVDETETDTDTDACAAVYAADIGFGDDINDAVYRMVEEKDDYLPYSNVVDFYTPEKLFDALFRLVSSHIHRISADIVRQNPYYLAISPKKAKAGRISLLTSDYVPYEFFRLYHEDRSGDNPFFYADIGFFDEKVTFSVLEEEGRVWMSIVHSEIRSMAVDIEKAHGRVVTYGLGLGYYAFMAARKESVESVTVVERNPDVIKLFSENILPQIPFANKIKIVEADAFDFLKAQEDGAYDFAYADFWEGAEDGCFLYLDFLKEAARFRKTEFAYWIESCFIEEYFRPAVLEWMLWQAKMKREFPRTPSKIRRMTARFTDFLKEKDGEIRDSRAFLSSENLTRLVREFAIKG